jgi:DNA-binding transcriptional MerR regulator
MVSSAARRSQPGHDAERRNDGARGGEGRSRRGAPESASQMNIGSVLSMLRPEFPDVSISKIRYFEEQGLVEPERTPAGYRKFSLADVERLRYVLGVQRDHYLPLRVIRDHLEALDNGQTPPVPIPAAAPGGPRLVAAHGEPAVVAPPTASSDQRYTRGQLLEKASVDEDLLAALESFGLVIPRPGGAFDGDAVTVARTAGELAAFGIEPRHLRAFRSAADREAGLVEQVVRPMRSQRDTEAAARAEETTREVSGLCVRLHAALVKTALDRI